MKQLSIWAHIHPWKARLVMIISWILLGLLAYLAGTGLKNSGIQLPESLPVVLIVLFLLPVLFYPFRRMKKRIGGILFYRWQKSCDFLLAISSFGLIFYAAHQPGSLFRNGSFLYAATTAPVSLPKDSSAKVYLSIKTFSQKMYGEDGKLLKWKERKKMLKEQVKALKKSDLTKSEKTILIILSALVAAGLLLLVTGLACSLSCNGSGGAAVLVGIGGIGLTVFLLIFVIRKINGRKKMKNKEEVPSTE